MSIDATYGGTQQLYSAYTYLYNPMNGRYEAVLPGGKEEYIKNPQVTRERMFYETMEDVLPRLKVVIDGTDGTETILPLDSFTTTGGSSAGSSVNSAAGAADSQNADRQ